MTAQGTAYPVEIRGVHKSFQRATGEAVKALDAVSFTVQRNTLTALVGPDGGGKTTLLRMIAGLVPPDEGSLRVLGIDVAADPQSVQDQIGYMPQKFGLYEDLTVQQNLDLYADLHGISIEARAEIYPRLLHMTALTHFTDRLAGNLSGGMKQKLGLACTLVRSPDLLLLDEPTAGVDPLSRKELWEILGQLIRDTGLTVIVSTSYLDEAGFCDHTVVFHAGKVLAEGPPQAITARAEGCVFMARTPAGVTARSLQARLFRQHAIVDAVPEAGNVRIVTRAAESPTYDVDSAPLVFEPTAPRFEDGFMKLFRGAIGDIRSTATTQEQRPRRRLRHE